MNWDLLNVDIIGKFFSWYKLISLAKRKNTNIFGYNKNNDQDIVLMKMDKFK